MSPQPSSEVAATTAEYSPEERKTLLQLAHRAIGDRLRGMKTDVTPPSEHLAEKRGAGFDLQATRQRVNQLSK